MKLNFTKMLPAVIAGLFAGAQAQAQDTKPSASSEFKTWTIGVNAGTTSPVSPFGGPNDYSNWKNDFGYGLYIQKQITPYFGLKLDGNRAKLKADNTEPYKSGAVISSPFQSFKTDVNYNVTLNAVVNMFNWSMFKQQNNAHLYGSVGGGVINYTATTVNAANATLENETVNKLNIPVGLGMKFRLSNNVNFDLGWTVNFVDADNLDGYDRGNGNDKYNYAHAGLEFALGNGSKQLAFYSPTAATYDEAIAAKNTANALKGDLDAAKADNAKLRGEMADLLKDSDGDGVADKLDKCADTPTGTVVDGSGCPLKVPAQVTEKVIITEADRKVVADAIKNLEFDFGKSTIRSKSYPTLNRVAALLIQKNFSLKLAGHTDNVGSDAANMKLSKDRAESIKAYLVSQGANASRVEAIGYGESQPISSNKTAAGRQKNRRVEFTLY
jgi:OOP family OmpA-OmpF porin